MNVLRLAFYLVVAALAGIVGYQAGLAQGLAQVGATAAAVAYYAPYGFGFGFFGLLFPLLFLFLIFGLGRALFWGGRWGGGRGYPGGPRKWGDPQAMLEDWHKRAHGEATEASGPTPPERS